MTTTVVHHRRHQTVCAERRASVNRSLPPTVCYHRCQCGGCAGTECHRCRKPIEVLPVGRRRQMESAASVRVLRDQALTDGVEACVSSLMPMRIYRCDESTPEQRRQAPYGDVLSSAAHWTPSDTVVEGRRLTCNGALSFSSADLRDTDGIEQRRRSLMSIVAHRAAFATGTQNVAFPLASTDRAPPVPMPSNDTDAIVDAAVHGRVVLMHRHGAVVDARLATPGECRRMVVSLNNDTGAPTTYNKK